MKIAMVTGASSGIGLAICKKLIAMNYRVYGLARDFSKTKFKHAEFKTLTCDVTHSKQLEQCVDDVFENEKQLDVLINNAGVGFFAPHEEIKVKDIERLVQTNLQAPLVLTRLVLRKIKQSEGFIINIASITAVKSSPIGSAYAATKAGIKHFSDSLFDEVRKYGVKVTTILPDMTKTPFYDGLHFKEHDDADSHVTSECVADAVETILSQRKGTVVTEMIVRPQKHQIEKKKKNDK
ncbi:SDR family oxidoreductase [bacterium]|nr:SDR family oxidoreductase [bacterium]